MSRAGETLHLIQVYISTGWHIVLINVCQIWENQINASVVARALPATLFVATFPSQAFLTFQLGQCNGMNYVSSTNLYVEALSPGTLECDCIWKIDSLKR